MSQAAGAGAPGSEDLAPAGSRRFLGTQDSASGSVFGDTQELGRPAGGGGGVDEEKGRG